MDSGSAAAALQDLHILVVEDVATLAWLVRDVLVEAGAKVVGPVPDVARALALIEENRVDTAVLDVNLGDETADPIADILAVRAIPFLFLTGYARVDMEGRHSARPFLSKPVRPTVLVRALADLAAGHLNAGDNI
jgi:CheY-like chemotaxis protein